MPYFSMRTRREAWFADNRNVGSSFTHAVIVGLLFLTSACSGRLAQEGVHTVRPVDNADALINPDMGWTLHYYSNLTCNYGSKLEASDTLDDFPGLSTVYLRVPWAYLEPREGKYNWALLDTPAQRWIAQGKRVALRVTCSENWMTYATPEWVRDAGARGTFYRYGKGRVEAAEGADAWDPFFDDPVFLAKLDNFLAAYAARYDANPHVAFVDVGTYGLWGEGHTHASSLQDSLDIQKRHIDLHLKHFKKTLLCISDDFAGHDKPGRRFPITDYALANGVTLRDDSILTHPDPNGPSWHHAEMAEAFWPQLPVILEHQHYHTCKEIGTWRPDRIVESVEAYHASYMSIHGFPRAYLAENRAMIDKVNQRMGYRILPTRIAWPKAVRMATPQDKYTAYEDMTAHGDLDAAFTVAWSWMNKGVAPCYPGGFPALTLKDEQGGIVSVLVDETFDVRSLGVGPAGEVPVKDHESEFVLGLYAPTTRPGTYAVYVSVGSADGTPQIALPLDGDDGHRRYKVGVIEVLPAEDRRDTGRQTTAAHPAAHPQKPTSP
ncbi:MAG: beta-galactosidase [Planctomycetota bacterium]